jgi:hypothetical protein
MRTPQAIDVQPTTAESMKVNMVAALPSMFAFMLSAAF